MSISSKYKCEYCGSYLNIAKFSSDVFNTGIVAECVKHQKTVSFNIDYNYPSIYPKAYAITIYLPGFNWIFLFKNNNVCDIHFNGKLISLDYLPKITPETALAFSEKIFDLRVFI